MRLVLGSDVSSWSRSLCCMSSGRSACRRWWLWRECSVLKKSRCVFLFGGGGGVRVRGQGGVLACVCTVVSIIQHNIDKVFPRDPGGCHQLKKGDNREPGVHLVCINLHEARCCCTSLLLLLLFGCCCETFLLSGILLKSKGSPRGWAAAAAVVPRCMRCGSRWPP